MTTSSAKAKILVFEHDTNLLDILRTIFRTLEHRVKTTDDETLQTTLREDPCDLIVCDLPGWFTLQRFSSERHLPPVVVTAGYAELDQARQATACGVTAVLPLPVRASQADKVVQEALTKSPLAAGRHTTEPAAISQAASPITMHFNTLVGEHPTMQELYSTVDKVAPTDLTVLIRGESGTGKDLVAHAIHDASPRAGKPFIALNCAAMPANLLESELFGHVKGAFTGALTAKEGLFKAADGGTIFLDEIGSIPVTMQLSLLRVLQDHTIRPVGSNLSMSVDVRVVAATNENLEARIQSGQFREDLYFRLAAFPIAIPPLRERQSDVPLLAQCFLQRFNQQLGKDAVFSATALEALQHYDWPGNVRELQHLIQRTVTLLPEQTSTIETEHLPLPTVHQSLSSQTDTPHTPTSSIDQEQPLTLKAYLHVCERDYVRKILDICNQDKEQAAKLLGISLGTFYRKYEELKS